MDKKLKEWIDSAKGWIDSASYLELLEHWRLAPSGDPMFLGEVGVYYEDRMQAKRDEVGLAVHIAASKAIDTKNEGEVMCDKPEVKPDETIPEPIVPSSGSSNSAEEHTDGIPRRDPLGTFPPRETLLSPEHTAMRAMLQEESIPPRIFDAILEASIKTYEATLDKLHIRDHSLFAMIQDLKQQLEAKEAKIKKLLSERYM